MDLVKGVRKMYKVDYLLHHPFSPKMKETIKFEYKLHKMNDRTISLMISGLNEKVTVLLLQCLFHIMP